MSTRANENLKTIPYPAALTYTAHMWVYPPPRGQNSAEIRVFGFKICLPATGYK